AERSGASKYAHGNKSLEPARVGAFSSAVADHVDLSRVAQLGSLAGILMKRFLSTMSGPVGAAIVFLRLTYLVGQPSTLMLSFIVFSLVLALRVAFVVVHTCIAPSPQFRRIGVTSLAFCLIMACSWAVLWAISEELYIRSFTEPSSDVPGIERYIYSGNS